MTFERKVTAAHFGPNELKALVEVFELARQRIQYAQRSYAGRPISRTELAAGCGLSLGAFEVVDRLISDFFMATEEAKLT